MVGRRVGWGGGLRIKLPEIVLVALYHGIFRQTYRWKVPSFPWRTLANKHTLIEYRVTTFEVFSFIFIE